MVFGFDLSVSQIKKAIDIFEEHRRGISTANHVRRNNDQDIPEEYIDDAMSSPYLTEQEKQLWPSMVSRCFTGSAKKQKPKIANRVGYVYLMRNHRNGFTKIGFSKNPTHREETLQAEEPEVELLRKWPGSMQLELSIHALFESKRIRGEWFDLTEDDVDEICTFVALEEAA